jgi:hypothetical protein
MEILEQEFELAKIARKALVTIEENEKKNENLQRMFETAITSGMLAQAMSEPFDVSIFESKVKSDFNYFNYFSDKFDDEVVVETMNKMLTQYFKTIREIYEVINIKPEIFGKDLSNDVSEEEKNETVKVTLETYLNKHYYNLTSDKRIEIYESVVINNVKDLMQKHQMDVNEATTFAIKWCVFENFLHKLAFPGLIERKIQYLIESEDYGKVFDQEKVQNLYEQYCDQAKAISRVLAALV